MLSVTGIKGLDQKQLGERRVYFSLERAISRCVKAEQETEGRN